VQLKRIICLAFCLTLAGCNDAALMKRIVPVQDEATARNYVELLRRGEIDEVQGKLDPSVAQPDDREKLMQISGLFPKGEPQSSKVVGIRQFHNQAYSTTAITLEYELSDRWLLVTVTTKREGEVSTLLGLNASPAADSQENLNRFTFIGKSAVQYLILITALSSLLFTFYVFVQCALTEHLKMKLLWLIVVLLGIGKLGVSWLTGEWAFTPISIQIPCAQAVRPLYGPWTIAASFPLGALLFLNHRWKMKITGELIPQPAPPPGPQKPVIPSNQL
jgi:hypothetical protein